MGPGVSLVLIRLLQISYKLNMAFAAYLLENAMLVLALGRVFGHFLCSTVGVLDEPPGPTVGHWQLF